MVHNPPPWRFEDHDPLSTIHHHNDPLVEGERTSEKRRRKKRGLNTKHGRKRERERERERRRRKLFFLKEK